MKTILKETGIKYLMLVLFICIPISVFSSNLTVHMDDVSDGDTLAICNSDSITIIGMKGLSDGCFHYFSSSFDDEAVYSDTLLLSPSYEGMLSFEN